MKPSYPLSTLLSLSLSFLSFPSAGDRPFSYSFFSSSSSSSAYRYLVATLSPLSLSLLPIRSLTVFSLSFSTLYGAAVSAEQRTGARRAMHSLEGECVARK